MISSRSEIGTKTRKKIQGGGVGATFAGEGEAQVGGKGKGWQRTQDSNGDTRV